jgi:chemotaxis protein MotB
MPDKRPLIIRRPKKIIAGGHHGGAWKVAYADFVTAMMALFLVLWLLAATSSKQRVAISEYFRHPSPLKGSKPSQGIKGPGGTSNSMIKLGGTMDIAYGDAAIFAKRNPHEGKEKREQEKRRLEELLQKLKQAAEKSQALAPFKDQLLLDLTSEGLRVQIVDKQNRLMFDLGSAQLKDYTVEILHELAKLINQVPNHISISGHTDIHAYSTEKGYSNWELSADRANAARRALIEGGMTEPSSRCR